MTVMTSVTDMPWTFAVVFLSIFTLLLVGAVVWLSPNPPIRWVRGRRWAWRRCSRRFGIRVGGGWCL